LAPCPAKNDHSRKIFSSASIMVVVGISEKSDIPFSVIVISVIVASTAAHKQRKSQLLLPFMAVLKEPHPIHFMSAEYLFVGAGSLHSPESAAHQAGKKSDRI
jgi:hypothetical protein